MTYIELTKRIKPNLFKWEDIISNFPESNLNTLKVAIRRHLKRRQLIQVKRGVYLRPINALPLDILAASIHFPNCYLTAEAVLVKHGMENIYDLDPNLLLTSTHVSDRQVRSFIYKGISYIFSQITPGLFFGFRRKYSETLATYYYEAYVEKALLDYLYLRRPDPKLIYNFDPKKLKNFKAARYAKYLERYPKFVEEYYFI